MLPKIIPRYRDLPIKSTTVGAPPGSAWGVFDENGQKDVHGTKNFITREAVVAARQEIMTGESVVLNLPLHLPYNPCPGRDKLEHRVIGRAHGACCFDDEIRTNTQGSSQWDGLLHWANQDLEMFYNGVKYADVESKADLSLGLQALSQRGGIVARGVLLDFVRYAEKHSIEYDPLSNYAISFSMIQDMIQEEGLEIRQGDVLLVRSGVSKWIKASTPDTEGPFSGQCLGVDPSPELIEWLWDSRIAAVAGDAIAFEAVPAPDKSFLKLHTAALAGWGMHIGELFDLEALAEVAAKNQRWSFFLTVAPLNVEGGIASIANTLAVF